MMLTYKAAYKLTDGIYLGEVLDFPGTVSFGQTLDEARTNLAGALLDMGETNLLRGESLPLPNPTCTDAEADLEEPIYLVLQSGHQFSFQVAASSP
jgi:predicted RNase H-like HicB family nuclease